MNRNHDGMNISFNQEVILDSFMKNTEKVDTLFSVRLFIYS